MKKNMTVDIVVKKERGYNVISKMYVGPYSGDNMLRKEFGDLVKWAKNNRLKTGKWIFMELDGPDTPSNKRRWEACIEIIGKRRIGNELSTEDDGITRKRLPPQLVASVIFDPDKFAGRLVYHGLECWLDWRTKYHELKEDGPTREVYIGNPWTNARAWANSEVQVPVARMK